jgi:hypothetical protein
MYKARLVIEVENGKGGTITRTLEQSAEDFDILRETFLELVFFKSHKFADDTVNEDNFKPAAIKGGKGAIKKAPAKKETAK